MATVTILWPKDVVKVVTVSETLGSPSVAAAAATYVNQPSNRNAVWTDQRDANAEPKQTDGLHLTIEAKRAKKNMWDAEKEKFEELKASFSAVPPPFCFFF